MMVRKRLICRGSGHEKQVRVTKHGKYFLMVKKTMSQQRVRIQVKNQIDAAIAEGKQPKAPRSGLGLVLSTGARYRTLYDKNGITGAGRYYYDKTGIAPQGNSIINKMQQEKAGLNIFNYLTVLNISKMGMERPGSEGNSGE